MNNKYKVNSIIIEGIEPTEEYKEFIRKMQAGSVTMEELQKYMNPPYRIKNSFVREEDKC